MLSRLLGITYEGEGGISDLLLLLRLACHDCRPLLLRLLVVPLLRLGRLGLRGSGQSGLGECLLLLQRVERTWQELLLLRLLLRRCLSLSLRRALWPTRKLLVEEVQVVLLMLLVHQW